MNIDQAIAAAQTEALDRITARCKVDLFYLDKHILGYSDMTEATHGEVTAYTRSLLPHPGEYKLPTPTTAEEIVQTGSNERIKDLKPIAMPGFDPEKKRLLILMPRGTFKSSAVTVGFALQYILHNSEARILIDSETYGKAKAFLSEVKGHLESNQKYRAVFRHVWGVFPDANKKDGIWSDRELVIAARKQPKKEKTFEIAGIDVAKTGMHYDLIIFDDLHSEKNVTTKEQIEQVKNHYKLSLSLLDPGMPLIVIGTRWDFQDLYQYLIDEQKTKFNYVIKAAHNPDNTLFFPERLTEEFLQGQREDQGSYIYSCQYENNPVDAETAAFKQSYFRYIEPELLEGRPQNRYLLVDPSNEGEYSDFVAMVDASVDHEGRHYVKDVYRFKGRDSDIIDRIFLLHQKNNYRKISLETIAGAMRLLYDLHNEQRKRGIWLPLHEIKSRSKKKEDRILGLAPMYERGDMYHVRGAHQIDELEYELTHFPKGKHDDVMDALADLPDVAQRPMAVVSEEKREKRDKQIAMLTKPRSVRTGY